MDNAPPSVPAPMPPLRPDRRSPPGGIGSAWSAAVPALESLDPGTMIAQSVVDAYAECLRRWADTERAGVLIEDSGISHYVHRAGLGRPDDAGLRRRLRARVAPYRVVVLPLVAHDHWTLCVLVVDPQRRPHVPVRLLWADSLDAEGFVHWPPGLLDYVDAVAGHRDVRRYNANAPRQAPGDNNCAMHVMRNMEYLLDPPPGGDAPPPDWDAPRPVPDLRRALRPYGGDLTRLRGPLRDLLWALSDDHDGDRCAVLRAGRHGLCRIPCR
jgi:hypothetical protein